MMATYLSPPPRFIAWVTWASILRFLLVDFGLDCHRGDWKPVADSTAAGAGFFCAVCSLRRI